MRTGSFGGPLRGFSEAALKKRAQKAKRQAGLQQPTLEHYLAATQRPPFALEAKLWDVDSEGEQVTLCAHCLLPVGEAGVWRCYTPACLSLILRVGRRFPIAASKVSPHLCMENVQLNLCCKR